jgi:hypothetical protein
MRSTIYLDVDGVLLPHPSYAGAEFTDWQPIPGHISATWSPGLVRSISALSLERRWLTSWEDNANERLCPLFDWEPLPVLHYQPGSQWWKLDALVQHHEVGRPFIWIDDEIDNRRDDIGPAFDAALDTLDAPRLVISTWPSVGITLDHLDEMARFISVHLDVPAV